MKNQCHKRSGYIYKKFSTLIFSWFANFDIDIVYSWYRNLNLTRKLGLKKWINVKNRENNVLKNENVIKIRRLN